ncbi:aspartic peptidase domain-containing protein [Biscogniauxia sp. FL1348]|nr:aspartic peptidase domain-containing protein [Biscogniauxia sp. FL1348]
MSCIKMAPIFILRLVLLGIVIGLARAGGGNVRLPLRRQAPGSVRPPILGDARNTKPYGTDISQYDYTGFTVEMDLGIPPQDVYVSLDISSNELWVNPQCWPYADDRLCRAYSGYYDPQDSLTSEAVYCPDSWAEYYWSGMASGYYYSDHIIFAESQIERGIFGIANESFGMMTGVMGLGFGNRAKTNYSIFDQLISNGVVSRRQFSIGFGNVDSFDDGKSSTS